MRNEFRNHSREQLVEDVEAARLRLAFYDIQAQEAQEMEKEIGSNELLQQRVKDIEPFMLDSIYQNLNRKRRNNTKSQATRVTLRVLQVAAGILLIVFIGISTALAVSPEARMRAMELLINLTDEYTVIGLGEAGGVDVPARWQGDYYLTYIPEGFMLHDVIGTTQYASAEYCTDDLKWLNFDEASEDSQTVLNTENANVYTTTVHDRPALVSACDGWSAVIWSEYDRYFCLTIDADAETALQIARSVTRIR